MASFMTVQSFRPLIGLSSCVAVRNGGSYHEVKNQYHEAVLTCTSGLAVSIPAMTDFMDVGAYVNQLDGLVLTGSLSNVHPSRYGFDPSPPAEPYDQRRDDLTFTLLEQGLACGLPTLCICRGFEEANVFFGGTLHTEIHKVQGFHDHRRPQVPDVVGQFGFHHSVDVFDGQWATWLHDAGALPDNRQVQVNSLHVQGVKDLGLGLHVEARASDGLVEAFSKPDLPGFFWAAQFHYEWDAINILQYRVVFEAFNKAVEARRRTRT